MNKIKKKNHFNTFTKYTNNYDNFETKFSYCSKQTENYFRLISKIFNTDKILSYIKKIFFLAIKPCLLIMPVKNNLNFYFIITEYLKEHQKHLYHLYKLLIFCSKFNICSL